MKRLRALLPANLPGRTFFRGSLLALLGSVLLLRCGVLDSTPEDTPIDPPWTQTQKLTASDAQVGDKFGFSVAISGDVAVVGAFTEDSSGSDAGAAYLFESSGGVWTQVAQLTASDAQSGDRFGVSVAVSGGVAVVGAWLENSGGSNAGAAYIFK